MTLEERMDCSIHIPLPRSLKEEFDKYYHHKGKIIRGLMRQYCAEQNMAIYKVNLEESGSYHAAISIAGVREPSQLYSIMKFIGRL